MSARPRRDPSRAAGPLLHGLVGYHVCCPRCGFVTAVLNGTGVAITESDEGAVSFSHPPRCVYCSVLLGLTDGAFALKKDEHVRSVRYR